MGSAGNSPDSIGSSNSAERRGASSGIVGHRIIIPSARRCEERSNGPTTDDRPEVTVPLNGDDVLLIGLASSDGLDCFAASK